MNKENYYDQINHVVCSI